MRIGIVTSSFPRRPGDSRNAGVFVSDFASYLADDNHKVVIVTPQSVKDHDRRITVRSIPWPGRETSLTHVDHRRLRGLTKLAMMLVSGAAVSYRALARPRVDHALAMWAIPSGLWTLLVRRLRRIPYSVWALGSDIWDIEAYPFGRPLLRRILRGADHLYADGLQLAEDVARLSGRECAFLPTSRRLPPAEARPQALDPRYQHFLCVARFHRNKGVDVLLDAVSSLEPEIRARSRFHIFGAGPEETTLRATLSEQGLEDCVSIQGTIGRSTLASYLTAVDALLIPSRIESIPLILSDAAQARCPVIATDVGDVGTLVREHAMGVVIPPGSPRDLASALRRAVEQPVTADDRGAERLEERLHLRTSVTRFLRDIDS